MNTLYTWLRGFYPEPIAVNHTERLRACGGALLGILVTGMATYWGMHAWGFSDAQLIPYLIAPMGASAVLLFAVPSSPLAQPWSMIGGNVVAAVVGVTCAMWIDHMALAAALAISLSIATMFALRCIHPPSGAVALTAVLGGPEILAQGYHFVLYPVGVNSILLLITALIYNNLTHRSYPHVHARSTHANQIPAEMRFGFNAADLDEVLKEYNQVLEVSRDDLQDLLQQTQMHAYRRRFGEITCADIMAKQVHTVEFGTELEEAWTIMRKHKIKALPVIDRMRRVIGIITQVDFMKNANLEVYEGFESKFRRFIQRTAHMHAEKPEAVGQIMSTPVVTAKANMHMIELIPLMTQQRILHHIPVVDDDNRLVGIVTQSDLVSALYHGRMANTHTLGLSS